MAFDGDGPPGDYIHTLHPLAPPTTTQTPFNPPIHSTPAPPTRDREHRVEQPAVVDLDRVVAQVEIVQDLGHDLEHLGVGDHRRVRPRDVKVALEELAVVIGGVVMA